MNADHGHIINKDDPSQEIMPPCPEPGKIFRLSISPLGWSIKARLVCAVVASAILWLSVAWAIGWLG